MENFFDGWWERPYGVMVIDEIDGEDISFYIETFNTTEERNSFFHHQTLHGFTAIKLDVKGNNLKKTWKSKRYKKSKGDCV